MEAKQLAGLRVLALGNHSLGIVPHPTTLTGLKQGASDSEYGAAMFSASFQQAKLTE